MTVLVNQLSLRLDICYTVLNSVFYSRYHCIVLREKRRVTIFFYGSEYLEFLNIAKDKNAHSQ